jgi:adenylyl-sulfate kinase
MAQQAWTLWLTGLPGAGKTTLALALKARLDASGAPAVLLDSDAVRRALQADTYTPAERDRFYRQLVDLAALVAESGVGVIIAATGHRRSYRAYARERLSPFAEVWVRCPPAVCQRRDPKGLYARSALGAAAGLPGVGVPYEQPQAPELVVDTDRSSVADAAQQLIAYLPNLARRREQGM